MRPLIYLDQNVLGLYLSGSIRLPADAKWQWVYSTEHLAEIRRSPEPERFLAVLDEIGARRLTLQLNDWKITDSAILHHEGTAAEHFAQYRGAVGEVEVDERMFDPMQAWVNGGGSKELLMELPERIARELARLLEEMGMSSDPTPGVMQDELSVSLEEMAKWGNNIDATRAALGLGKGAAGSLTGEKQLQRLWQLLEPKPPGITMDQFFGFEPNGLEPQEPRSKFLGIAACCAILNILGFQAEKKCRDVEWVPNVRSDAAHIAMGGFCAGLISADKRLIGRARAIYEYKTVGTRCVLLPGG